MESSPTVTRITKLLVQETGAYHDMYRRTYATDYSVDIQNIFNERLHHQPQFTPTLVAGVAGQFLTVNSAPEKDINIPNGFGTRRFRFLLEVTMTDLMGNKSIEIVSGYSDAFQVTLNTGSGNHIDPNMIFNINSIISISETTEWTPTGRQVHRQIIDNSHLLVDRNSQGMRSAVREETMRPEDLFSHMSMSHASAAVLQHGYDARTTLSTRPVKSNRQNNVASNYVAKSLEAFNGAWVTNQLSENPSNLYTEALGLAGERETTTDPFLRVLQQVRGVATVSTMFTLNDLEKLDPGCTRNNQVFKPTIFKEAQRAATDNRHMDNGMQTWDGTTVESQIATVLMQSVPSIMMELMLTGVEFQATNKMLTTRENVVNIEGHLAFVEGVDMPPYLRTLERRLAFEVMNGISKGGMIDYHIKMRVDILHEAQIQITVYGRPPALFKAPAFCDALYVPVVTNNHEHAIGIANDFEHLSLNLISANGVGGNASAGIGSLNLHQTFKV